MRLESLTNRDVGQGHAGHAMACPVVGTLKLSGHQSLQEKKKRKRGEGRRRKKKKKREKRKKKKKEKETRPDTRQDSRGQLGRSSKAKTARNSTM